MYKPKRKTSKRYIHTDGNNKYIYLYNQYVGAGGFSAGHATTAGNFKPLGADPVKETVQVSSNALVGGYYSKQADISG